MKQYRKKIRQLIPWRETYGHKTYNCIQVAGRFNEEQVLFLKEYAKVCDISFAEALRDAVNELMKQVKLGEF